MKGDGWGLNMDKEEIIKKILGSTAKQFSEQIAGINEVDAQYPSMHILEDVTKIREQYEHRLRTEDAFLSSELLKFNKKQKKLNKEKLILQKELDNIQDVTRSDYNDIEFLPNRFTEFNCIKHHITNDYYIWIPEHIHLACYEGNDIERHRDNVLYNKVVLMRYPELKSMIEKQIKGSV